MQIKSRYSDVVIYDAIECDTIIEALEKAAKAGANLRGADLRGADLRGANLRGADLYGADLRGALNPPLWYNTIPEGELVAYKKLSGGAIATLTIPKEAKRSRATTNKCRAEYAIATAIHDSNGTAIDIGVSKHDESFAYRVGETVRPTEPFCEDRWNECASGIHFFFTKLEAEMY